mmetsp:Transcript_7428/g.15387  ORF Transcript_7428/g.15387 Transcript_7428/m.15387 type:complete len:237 (-) Transcript_7428:706-1416(-)
MMSVNRTRFCFEEILPSFASCRSASIHFGLNDFARCLSAIVFFFSFLFSANNFKIDLPPSLPMSSSSSKSSSSSSSSSPSSSSSSYSSSSSSSLISSSAFLLILLIRIMEPGGRPIPSPSLPPIPSIPSRPPRSFKKSKLDEIIDGWGPSPCCLPSDPSPKSGPKFVRPKILSNSVGISSSSSSSLLSSSLLREFRRFKRFSPNVSPLLFGGLVPTEFFRVLRALLAASLSACHDE